MEKAIQQKSASDGPGDAKNVMGPNKLKAYRIVQKGIVTATQLFNAVDATAAAMFNQELDARDANSFFGSQRLKLSTVQTVHRIKGSTELLENAPLFGVSKTRQLGAQEEGLRKSEAKE